jgi:mono/diheme cytochrome c family protein
VGVLNFALQHCGAGLGQGDRVLWEQVEQLAQHPAKTVRWHVACALAEVEGKHAARALALCARMGAAVGKDDVLLDALVAAGNGREGAFVRALVAESALSEDAARLMRALASECGRERDRSGLPRRLALLDAAIACPQSWQQRALLDGLRAALPEAQAQRAGFYVFQETPAPLVQLLASQDAQVVKLAQQVMAAVALRPDAGAPPVVDDAELSTEARALLAKGSTVFQSVCAACHQLDGRGMAGLAPPLRNSEWVTGEADVLVRIALHGVRGPIDAAGQRFEGEMPGQAYLPDGDLAAVLSWLRRSFGHQADVIDAAAIKAIRDRHPGRTEPWTAAQLRATAR